MTTNIQRISAIVANLKNGPKTGYDYYLDQLKRMEALLPKNKFIKDGCYVYIMQSESDKIMIVAPWTREDEGGSKFVNYEFVVTPCFNGGMALKQIFPNEESFIADEIAIEIMKVLRAEYKG